MKSYFYTSLAFLLLTSTLTAQTYVVGDVVEDYAIVDYNTGSTTSLYELGAEGGVLVLEWFAHWCPFCASAAANVEQGIIGHYGIGGDNPNGVPVHHIALNVQGNARAQSDVFINTYGFTTVLEDYSRTFFRLFSPTGGQPLFVIINAEANSPSAERWEVLYTRLNYASSAAPDISALMRPVIDQVEAGRPEIRVEDVFPQAEMIANFTGVYTTWMGPTWTEAFPIVFTADYGFLHVEPTGTESGVFLSDLNGGWFYTEPAIFPILYDFQAGSWTLN